VDSQRTNKAEIVDPKSKHVSNIYFVQIYKFIPIRDNKTVNDKASSEIRDKIRKKANTE